MSNLLKAYEAAKVAVGKTRAFRLAGESVELPRLNLGSRAQFEAWMGKRRKGFSLAALRNRALLELASAAQRVKDKWQADGLPNDLDDGLRSNMNARIAGEIGPYMDAILSPLDSDAQAHAIYLALRQTHGDALVVEDGTLEVTPETIGVILDATPANVVSDAALYVLGLTDWTDEAPETPETADEMVEGRLGDPKDFETPASTTSTTPPPSPSSVSTTDETSTGPGG